MCQGRMHDFLVALPKCEHHMHIEGSLEPALLFELAKRNNISLPSAGEDESFKSVDTLLERYGKFTSLDDFLHYYFIGMSVLINSSDFEALAWAYFQRAHKDNVVHAEVFFDPQAHTSRGVAYETIVSGLVAAQKRAESELKFTSELIVCILRHLPAEDGQKMYESALPDLESGRVRGLGLSSTEKGHPPTKFQQPYSDAKSKGILRTAHAGEEADVSYMKSALYDLDIQRCDHGIKLPDDPELMAEFARRKILVTMCPLSNVELKCVKSVKDIPVRKYLDNGVKFSINSDDPAYFGGYILDNYCAVQEAFDLSIEEWARIETDAIIGSWCKEQRKDDMLRMLADMLEKFGPEDQAGTSSH